MERTFQLKFDGQQHSIDANTLINSLIHTSSAIQEINRNLDSGKKIEIKIKALEKGSFLVNIELLESLFEQAQSLFNKETIDVAANIIGILGCCISIKQFLGGKEKHSSKEVAGDNIEITNNSGNILVVKNLTYNIYQSSPIIRESIAQNFETLRNDSSVSGFEIIENGAPIVAISKEDFGALSQLSEEIQADERTITEAANLHIIRPSFDSNLKWDFYFRGNKISAFVKDPVLYRSINAGQPFAKGDILEVELETVQKFDQSVNTYVNKTYHIKKMIRFIGRVQQQELNFTQE